MDIVSSLLFALAVVVVPLGCGTVAPPAEARLVLQVQPGKPDAPTEQVVIERSSDGIRLTALRTAAPGEVLDRGIATLGEKDLQRVWNVVRAWDLTCSEPPPSKPTGADLGTVALSLRWRAAGEARYFQHELSWTGTIDDVAGVRPLADALRDLLRRHLPDVPIYYLG